MDLQEYKGEISWNQLIIIMHQVQIRNASEALRRKENKTPLRQARLKASIDATNRQFADSVATFKFLSRNLDQMELKAAFSLQSGPDALICARISETVVKMPVLLEFASVYSKLSIPYSKIPYVWHTRPHDDGDYTSEWEATRDGLADDERSSSSRVSGSTTGTLLASSNSSLSKSRSGSSLSPTTGTAVCASNSAVFSSFCARTRAERIDQQRHEVDVILAALPVAISSTIAKIYIKQPSISAVFDQTTSVQAGAELFSYKMGKKVQRNEEEAEAEASVAAREALPSNLFLYEQLIQQQISQQEEVCAMDADGHFECQFIAAKPVRFLYQTNLFFSLLFSLTSQKSI